MFAVPYVCHSNQNAMHASPRFPSLSQVYPNPLRSFVGTQTSWTRFGCPKNLSERRCCFPCYTANPQESNIIAEGVVLGAAFFRFLGAAFFMEKCEKARVFYFCRKKQNHTNLKNAAPRKPKNILSFPKNAGLMAWQSSLGT